MVVTLAVTLAMVALQEDFGMIWFGIVVKRALIQLQQQLAASRELRDSELLAARL